MVHFLYLTSDFATVDEVIREMPEPIETSHAVYRQPRSQLYSFLDELSLLETMKNDDPPPTVVIDGNDQPLDRAAAIGAHALQRILRRELEEINSALCRPCNCTLCCIGPDGQMRQDFFEIPLADDETTLFRCPQTDTALSRAHLSMDAEPLLIAGDPFYTSPASRLIRWKKGWSLILPKESRCPNLDCQGRCEVYPDRPDVCRRPQLFAYILEPTKRPDIFRLRNTLLGVIDCPYVAKLRDEIAAYAAASELQLILRHNKQ
jgi:Fe-S-cluster containining protein